MYRPRRIPVLLLQDGGLVKSIQFKKHQYIGDPINAVKIYNDLKADELVFLDINATANQECISIELVKEIGEEANMPFSVGGGIHTLEQIRMLVEAGAERVIIGNKAAEDFSFIKAACEQFGSSTIAVCIDVKKSLFGKEQLVTNNARKTHKIAPVDFAKQMEACGVGELIVQSVDKDGQMNGFDNKLVKQIADAVTISIVALGGGGNQSHFDELFNFVPVSGIASGSRFVYKDNMRGVLINY